MHFFGKAGVLGSQARVVSSLDVGVLILMWGRCFGPQDECVASIGVLFGEGEMLLTLEVRSVLMLPWAQKVLH